MKKNSVQSVVMDAGEGKKNVCSTFADHTNTRYIATGKNTTPAFYVQQRISEAEKSFNLLYGNIPAETAKFGYLWTKKGEELKTYPFDISNVAERAKMARKAIELSDNGADVYYGVNLMDTAPAADARAKTEQVTMQTAVVTDIDIEGGNHTSSEQKKYPPNFDVAKSFLPFEPSILINSGYGLHALNIFNPPISITADNRAACIERNKKFLEIIRSRAGIYQTAVDAVHDLPRVLRVPGTYNYKMGRDNAPLCHIVEVNDIRFTPADMDAKLNSLIVDKPPTTKSARTDYVNDNPDLKEYRIRRMLDYINVVDGEYDKWLDVGFGLFNEGFDCSLWEQWSRSQPEFKEGEIETKWKSFRHEPNGITIATLYQFAVEGGYDEKEIQREYYQLHPELSTKNNQRHAPMVALKAELRENAKALDDFEKEKIAALERLRNVDTFDSETVFAEEILTAAAFAKIFDRKIFSDFKRDIINYGNQHKDKKVAANDWNHAVKDKEEAIQSRQTALTTRRNEIQAEIKSLNFVTDNDVLKGLSFPTGYGISAQGGIEKVAGEILITVCRRPVIVSGKTFNVDEKIYKLNLSFMTQNGKWKTISAVDADIPANSRKIVDLAKNGLPVTSVNALNLVDYLDAFNAENENALPLTYNTNRCGWHSFNGKKFFVDPRRTNAITDDDKTVCIKVDDSKSEFARHLTQSGTLENWKKAYDLAKKSPIARLIVDAAIAPILLDIVGERNFLLFICAPTRAGKTTALTLAASTIGDEKIIRSFDATKNGLAGAAADVNDYAFLVDEKQVADNYLKDQFDNIVYALANGIGRTKLNRDSTLKATQFWRTIVIMTGETLLLADNVTGGAFTRQLPIKTAKGILDADTCRDIRALTKENCGHVLPLVADKIFEFGFDKIREVYGDVADALTEKYPELLNEYCRYMALLTVADGLLNSSLGTKNALKEATFALSPIFPLIPTISEISDTTRESDFVRAIIAQNQNRFIGGNVAPERMQAVLGKLNDDDGYTYIAAKFLQEECSTNGFDYRKLVDDLVTDGFFIPDTNIKKGRKTPLSTVQKRIGEVNTRCFRIKNSVFNGAE